MAEHPFTAIIPGLTETARDTETPETRLGRLMMQRSGGSQEDISDAMRSLERAFSRESNEKLKSRIVAAQTILREGPSHDSE